MASHHKPRRRYTYADYAALEPLSPEKHEFFDGDIYLMAGGTEDHSTLASNINAALNNALGDRACKTHTSDMRIYVEAVGLATYPDASVICGEFVQHPASPRDTALNPAIVVEVTSDSSEDYDTGEKLEAYRTIPSVRECVIISHRERRITVHRREDRGWKMYTAIAGGRVRIETLDTALVVDEIYKRTSVA
jgi:Uma2 family endonuclease